MIKLEGFRKENKEKVYKLKKSFICTQATVETTVFKAILEKLISR